MPETSNKPWGLIVPGRPSTPSEGAAQTYMRVGPSGSQKTRTFDNGTCLTFGPDDLVDEFDPYSHPFYDQVALVDTVVRDCRAARRRYEGVSMATTNRNDDDEEEEEQVDIAADDPFNDFRLSQIPKEDLKQVQQESGKYYRVPSKHASCANYISLYSMTNKSDALVYPGLRQDTRFGVTCKPAEQNHRFRPKPGGPGYNSFGRQYRGSNNDDGDGHERSEDHGGHKHMANNFAHGRGSIPNGVSNNFNTDNNAHERTTNNNLLKVPSAQQSFRGGLGGDRAAKQKLEKAEQIFSKALQGYRATGQLKPNRALSKVMPRPQPRMHHHPRSRTPAGAAIHQPNLGQLRAEQLFAERYLAGPADACREDFDAGPQWAPDVQGVENVELGNRVIVPPPWVQLAQVNRNPGIEHTHIPDPFRQMAHLQHLQEHTIQGYGIPPRPQSAPIDHPIHNGHGMLSRLQTPPPYHTFDNGYDMHLGPFPGMPASNLMGHAQLGHDFEGPEPAQPPSDQLYKANIKVRTRRGGHTRLQSQANKQYAKMLDEENATSRRRGEVPLRGDVMSGDSVLQAQLGVGISIRVDPPRTETKTVIGKAGQMGGQMPVQMPVPKVNAAEPVQFRPMTYKEEFERSLQRTATNTDMGKLEQMPAHNEPKVNAAAEPVQSRQMANKEDFERRIRPAETKAVVLMPEPMDVQMPVREEPKMNAAEPIQVHQKACKEDFERRSHAISEAKHEAAVLATEAKKVEDQAFHSNSSIVPGGGIQQHQLLNHASSVSDFRRLPFSRQSSVPNRTRTLLSTLNQIQTGGPAIEASLSTVSLPTSPVRAREPSTLEKMVSLLPREPVNLVTSQKNLKNTMKWERQPRSYVMTARAKGQGGNGVDNGVDNGIGNGIGAGPKRSVT